MTNDQLKSLNVILSHITAISKELCSLVEKLDQNEEKYENELLNNMGQYAGQCDLINDDDVNNNINWNR